MEAYISSNSRYNDWNSKGEVTSDQNIKLSLVIIREEGLVNELV